MGEINETNPVFFGWRCDKAGCPAEWRLPEPFHGYSWQRGCPGRVDVMLDGWTFWASRSRHVFCPDHKPSKGSKMRQVEP